MSVFSTPHCARYGLPVVIMKMFVHQSVWTSLLNREIILYGLPSTLPNKFPTPSVNLPPRQTFRTNQIKVYLYSILYNHIHMLASCHTTFPLFYPPSRPPSLSSTQKQALNLGGGVLSQLLNPLSETLHLYTYMTLLIWQCSKDSPLQQPCCFYFIFIFYCCSFFLFKCFYKVIYKVNILCIHSLFCPLLYFELKNIQSSPSLVLNSEIRLLNISTSSVFENHVLGVSAVHVLTEQACYMWD